jgi:preprotein translocase subunit SecE
VEKVAEANAKKVSFFKGVRNEFKKIIWPNTNTIAKNTYVVVLLVLILGAVIAGLDAGLKFLILDLLLGNL